MTDKDAALAARDDLRDRFGNHSDVERIGIGADTYGWYVGLVTKAPIGQLPLRTASNVRVRQFRKGYFLPPDLDSGVDK